VTQDLEQFKYNTVVSKLMVLVNEIYSAGVVHKEQFSVLMQLLAPLTPALAEKYRLMLGQSDSIHMSAWPTYDPSVLIEDEVTIAIQVNGKMRGTIDVVRDMSQDDVLVQAHQIPSIAKYIEGGEIARVIFVPNKIINIIIT
jgi:leucyl-tRNA synthetase